MSGPEPGSEQLSRSELRRRATGGVFVVGSFGLLNLVVGLGGSIALARLLAPRDFGLVAVGATVMMFAQALSDGGLGAGLIRREDAPTRRELRGVLGLQLAVTGVLAVVVAAVAASFGESGLVVSLMMVALPLASFQTPGRVVLSRALLFRSIASVDATAVLAYYAWAVGGAAAGFGVWALASGMVVRAVVAAVGMVVVARQGVLTPAFRGARALAPVVAFGIRFQGVHLAGLLREQGLNAGTAAVGGITTLGLWSFSKRLLELPVLMFEPLWRVSFPLMSGLLAQKEDVRPVLDRTVARAAAAAGLLLVPLAASATELVPGVFGDQWRDAGPVLVLGCCALLVAGPTSVAAIGYLYAVGAPSIVLRATVLHTAALYAVAFSLLPFLGVAAVGVGSLVGAVVDAGLLGRAVQRRTGARPYAASAAPLVLALAAGAAGTVVTVEVGDGLGAAVLGGAAAGAVYALLLLLLRRKLLVDTVSLAARAVRTGLRRESGVGAAASESA